MHPLFFFFFLRVCLFMSRWVNQLTFTEPLNMLSSLVGALGYKLSVPMRLESEWRDKAFIDEIIKSAKICIRCYPSSKKHCLPQWFSNPGVHQASRGEGLLKHRFLGPIPRISHGIRPGKLHFSQVPRCGWYCWSRAQALENFGLDHVDGPPRGTFHLEMMPQIISQRFPLLCFFPRKHTCGSPSKPWHCSFLPAATLLIPTVLMPTVRLSLVTSCTLLLFLLLFSW